MRDMNFLERVISILFGTAAGIVYALWWTIKGIFKLLRRVVIDVLKNIYLRIIALIASFILLALGLTSLSGLN